MGNGPSTPRPPTNNGAPVNNGFNQNTNQVAATVQNTVEVHNKVEDTEAILLSIIAVCVVVGLFMNLYNQHNKKIKKRYRTSTLNL